MNTNIKQLADSKKLYRLLQDNPSLQWMYRHYQDNDGCWCDVVYGWKCIKKSMFLFRMGRASILAFVALGFLLYEFEIISAAFNLSDADKNKNIGGGLLLLFFLILAGVPMLVTVCWNFSDELIGTWIEKNWKTRDFVNSLQLIAEKTDKQFPEALLPWLSPSGEELVLGDTPRHVVEKCQDIMFKWAVEIKKEKNVDVDYMKGRLNNFHHTCQRLMILPFNDQVGRYYHPPQSTAKTGKIAVSR